MKPTDGAGHGLSDLLEQEWLTTNHIGGYASSTIPSLNTRKYHGLLVAAMSPPVRRLVLLSRVEETITSQGWPVALACNEYPGAIHPDGYQSLRAFSPDPFPRWAYQGDGWSIEKSLQLLPGENTVVLSYMLIGAKKPLTLELRPLMAMRPIHDLMYQWNGQINAQQKSPGHHRVPPTSRTPEVFFAHTVQADAKGVATSGTFESAGSWYFNNIYRCEQARGYGGLEDLWSPGVVRWTLKPGETVHFVCSADPIDFAKAVAKADEECARLDAPIVSLPARDTDHDLLVRSAEGLTLDHLPTDSADVGLLTKLPWSAPSARDALIALPGALLVTGKFAVAKAMLLGLAGKLRGGMIPTAYPEDGSAPSYDGADTSLWFVNAVWQYLRYTGDEATTQRLFESVLQIARAYQHGAELGIHADREGLLCTCCPGSGTTWMDAKIGEWVVTPRAGRPVELNALWYNAVRIAAELSDRFGQAARAKELNALAATIASAFNQRFWNAREGCCYDVVDNLGSDPSIRPNQILAAGLPFPVLEPARHADLLDRVRQDLLTAVGPRTLSPRDPAYQGRYGGDVVSRDRAYHQGSVHPWLLGPLVTAHVRVFGRGEKSRDDARRMIQGCLNYMRGDGLGQLCELFDGDAANCHGGAIASAPAVGELLRCYVEDILDLAPIPKPAASIAPQIATTIAPKVRL